MARKVIEIAKKDVSLGITQFLSEFFHNWAVFSLFPDHFICKTRKCQETEGISMFVITAKWKVCFLLRKLGEWFQNWQNCLSFLNKQPFTVTQNLTLNFSSSRLQEKDYPLALNIRKTKQSKNSSFQTTLRVPATL